MVSPLEIEHGVDHVLEHARAGERASLVMWPTSTIATPLAFGGARQVAAHSRTCATGPGAELSWSE